MDNNIKEELESLYKFVNINRLKASGSTNIAKIIGVLDEISLRLENIIVDNINDDIGEEPSEESEIESDEESDEPTEELEESEIESDED